LCFDIILIAGNKRLFQFYFSLSAAIMKIGKRELISMLETSTAFTSPLIFSLHLAAVMIL
jgi:hypothetical protein